MTKTQYFREQIMQELVLASTPNSATKDILIVVHNQIEYVKKCINSIIANTENYNLWVFDNGSHDEMRDYLRGKEIEGKIYSHTWSRTNLGFIKPNNYMASQGTSEYIILINSDCEVRQGWDLAMVNYLCNHPDIGQVGYSGGMLGADGQGLPEAVYGHDIDYLCGWCFCIPRRIYDQVGLFDEQNLEFAYGEDSDLSLRLREQGWQIYSLHNDLVIHHGNKTIIEVHRERPDYLKLTFQRNHEHIRRRWSQYLEKRQT